MAKVTKSGARKPLAEGSLSIALRNLGRPDPDGYLWSSFSLTLMDSDNPKIHSLDIDRREAQNIVDTLTKALEEKP